MSIFGDLALRLDPWEADYGSELPLSQVPDRGSDRDVVDADIEVPRSEWRPILPTGRVIAPPRLIFVDGVRRIEARAIGRRRGRVFHAAFGSYGVGHVEVTEAGALLGEPRIERVLVIGGGESLPNPIEVGGALLYRAVSTAKPDADAPLARIQGEMRLAEERLARELANREDTLVVADGPLTFADPVRGSAVGYIKRIFELYVDGSLLEVLARLPPGARSPIFGLKTPERFARYSWFVRLAQPHPGESDLAGIVRLEVSDAVGFEAARRLADATAGLLPRFSPSRGRDPRAPQNLLPIGALEGQLRRRLGDARLVRRRIATLIAQEDAHS